MIGKNIKKFRLRLMHRNLHGRIIPMTQQMLADEIGCSLIKVKHYEQNLRTPTLLGFLKICLILKVSPNELVEGSKIGKNKFFSVKSIPDPENLKESFIGSKTEVI